MTIRAIHVVVAEPSDTHSLVDELSRAIGAKPYALDDQQILYSLVRTNPQRAFKGIAKRHECVVAYHQASDAARVTLADGRCFIAFKGKWSREYAKENGRHRRAADRAERAAGDGDGSTQGAEGA